MYLIKTSVILDSDFSAGDGVVVLMKSFIIRYIFSNVLRKVMLSSKINFSCFFDADEFTNEPTSVLNALMLTSESLLCSQGSVSTSWRSDRTLLTASSASRLTFQLSSA